MSTPRKAIKTTSVMKKFAIASEVNELIEQHQNKKIKSENGEDLNIFANLEFAVYIFDKNSDKKRDVCLFIRKHGGLVVENYDELTRDENGSKIKGTDYVVSEKVNINSAKVKAVIRTQLVGMLYKKRAPKIHSYSFHIFFQYQK